MSKIPTRFLVLSDTHGDPKISIPEVPVDVAIHCGDLIDGSKLHEFQTSLEQLRRIKSPLKLVIAGNHDFTLDTPTYQKKAAYSQQAFSIEPALMTKEYGHSGEARQIITDVQQGDGIAMLEEGTRHFDLQKWRKVDSLCQPIHPLTGRRLGISVQTRRTPHLQH